MESLFLLEEFIKEALIDEAKRKRKSKAKKKSSSKKRAAKKGKRKDRQSKKSTKYPSQYKATGKRKKTLDRATSLAKSKDPAKRALAYRIRDNQEDKERTKPNWKNKPRHDTKKS